MNRIALARRLAVLAREIAAAELSDKDVEEIADMADQNAHTEAVVYLFEKVLKDKRGTAAAKAIETLHEYFGSLPTGLSDTRYALMNRGLAAAKQLLSEEDYLRLHSSF